MSIVFASYSVLCWVHLVILVFWVVLGLVLILKKENTSVLGLCTMLFGMFYVASCGQEYLKSLPPNVTSIIEFAIIILEGFLSIRYLKKVDLFEKRL